MISPAYGPHALLDHHITCISIVMVYVEEFSSGCVENVRDINVYACMQIY